MPITVVPTSVPLLQAVPITMCFMQFNLWHRFPTGANRRMSWLQDSQRT